jgi:hypothetical protein
MEINMEVIQQLEKARNLIIDFKNWKRGWPTIKERNNGIHCSLTAIYDADSVPKHNYLAMNSLLMEAMKEIDPPETNYRFAIDVWNDTHTHEQVINAFNKAIELAWKTYKIENTI